MRSVSGLSLPPTSYGGPRGAFWKGTSELDRYPPSYPCTDDVFDEYLANKSLSPNKHAMKLSSSSGLLELHYDTMRKKQRARAAAPSHVNTPTMTRTYTAAAGYGGFIPGKESNNVVGCTFAHGSRIAHETRGKTYDPPMSGVNFSFRGRTQSSPHLSSLVNPLSPAHSSPGSRRNDTRGSQSSPLNLPMDRVSRDP